MTDDEFMAELIRRIGSESGVWAAMDSVEEGPVEMEVTGVSVITEEGPWQGGLVFQL
jgi:hypothetical protein